VSALTDWFDWFDKQKPRQCDYVLTSHVMIPAFTDADVIREATVLQQLAQLTADLDDPRDAAMTLFGGSQ
jgi:hypothetical protein